MDYSLFDDTIAAPATVPGTGAVTLLRVSGPKALRIVSDVVKCETKSIEETPAGRIRKAVKDEF